MNYTFRPIDTWPRERTLKQNPRRSAFKAKWSQTIDLLDRELGKLCARNVVIQIDLAEGDFRIDGLPRATARPATARVILAFDSKHGSLKYYADICDDWQANVRAIALGLEHLRAVDRYGITNRGEQYTGYKALPGPLLTPPTMTIEQAAIIIVDAAGGVIHHANGTYTSETIIRDQEVRRMFYRNAVKRTHPDRGGTPEAFMAVQQAYELLEQAGGL